MDIACNPLIEELKNTPAGRARVEQAAERLNRSASDIHEHQVAHPPAQGEMASGSGARESVQRRVTFEPRGAEAVHDDAKVDRAACLDEGPSVPPAAPAPATPTGDAPAASDGKPISLAPAAGADLDAE